MPYPQNSVPKYRKHKASGQAIVTVSGKDFYLGPHGTKTSHELYDRLIAEWLAGGRRNRNQATPITVVELIVEYFRFCKGYYRKNGRQTDTVAAIKRTLKLVRQFYGRTPAAEFGPRALKALAHHMIKLDWSRKFINENMATVKRMFKWGASEELVGAEVFHALQTVSGLRKNRCNARETAPVLPVDDSTVDTTLRIAPVQ